MRLIDAEGLKKAITQNRNIDRNVVCDVLDIIDNAPAVTSKVEFVTKNGITFPKALETMTFSHLLTTEERQNIERAYMLGVYSNERPTDEWVRKVDVIQSIAKQYSEHDELVPMWLSIGDIKGGADMRGDNMNNTCKGCIYNMGNNPGTDEIYCEYLENHINNTRCEYYEEDN